jgi:hypothetical protein
LVSISSSVKTSMTSPERSSITAIATISLSPGRR